MQRVLLGEFALASVERPALGAEDQEAIQTRPRVERVDESAGRVLDLDAIGLRRELRRADGATAEEFGEELHDEETSFLEASWAARACCSDGTGRGPKAGGFEPLTPTG